MERVILPWPGTDQLCGHFDKKDFNGSLRKCRGLFECFGVMPHIGALNQEDNILCDIGGMVCNAL
jgi:hypothetical protein